MYQKFSNRLWNVSQDICISLTIATLISVLCICSRRNRILSAFFSSNYDESNNLRIIKTKGKSSAELSNWEDFRRSLSIFLRKKITKKFNVEKSGSDICRINNHSPRSFSCHSCFRPKNLCQCQYFSS